MSLNFSFLLACILATSLIVTVPFSIATIVPYPTSFANSTKITFPNAAGTTGCPSNCTRNIGPLGSITWTARTITATVTAETLVYVVNKKSNSTRTETITNTELDLKDYTPLPTTKTTSVVLQFGTTSRTEILSFPTILYSDYPSSYTFCGTLPTTIAGVAKCLDYPCDHVGEGPFNSDSPISAYPSHPPIPNQIQNISASYLALDPKGSTWDAKWSYDGGYAPLIQPLMPDMAAWNCTGFGAWDAPASVLNTALYLTATSTSIEGGGEADETPAPQVSPSTESVAPGAGKQAAKVAPQAAETSEASQIFANPFGVKKPAAVAETPAPASSSPVAIAQVPSPDKATGDNNAGSNIPVSSPAPQEASPQKASPQEANSQEASPKEAGPDAGTSPKPAVPDSAGPSAVPAPNPASPEESFSVASSPSQGANFNQAVSPPVAAQSSSQKGSSNNGGVLAIPGLNNQAATAVPSAAATAVANVVISSTNAQGSVVVTTSQAPGVIITSANAQGSQVITTMPVVSPQVLDHAPKPAPVVVNGQILTTNSQSQYVIAGQTISANTPVVLGSGASTTPVVLQTSAGHTVLVIGSSTTTLHSPSSPPTPIATTPPAITIGTQFITANAQGQYIVGSQTLTPGGEIVIGATTASSGGTVAVAGGTTVSLAPTPTQAVVGASTEGLAPYIAGGLAPSGPNRTAVVPFVGGVGERFRCWRLRWLIGVVVGVVGVMM